MTGLVPTGYRLYAAVVSRLDVRGEGGDGLFFKCPFAARHANGDRTPSGRIWVANDGSLMLRCLGCGADAHALMEEIGLPITELFPDKGKKGRSVTDQYPAAKAVKEYEYRDKDGVLVAVKTRWEPGFDGSPKAFSWWRPAPPAALKLAGLPTTAKARVTGRRCLEAGDYSPHRAGDRVSFKRTTGDDRESVALPGVHLPIYRLPGLLAADPRHPVFVVEGEKDADLLHSLGFVATCGPAGAGKWCPTYAADLHGRRVVVCPDQPGSDQRDDQALEYARKVSGSALYFGAASVRIVNIPVEELRRGPDGAFLGGDITDWLNLRKDSGTHPRQLVAELCRRFPEYAKAVA